MLHFTLERRWRKTAYTIGRLYKNGEFLCNTVEDTDRGLHSNMAAAQIAKLKVPDQTAIPTGSYKVQLSESPKFKRVLPEVLNVPGYSGIRIHKGATADHSSGCIIPGDNTATGRVTNSEKYEKLIVAAIAAAEAKKEDVWLTII